MKKATKQGKIIAVVGAPRSGKSFLTKLLAKHYRGTYFLEGEEGDFPKRILEDITKNIRPLERVLWFRNQQIKQYLRALELKEHGKVVVMDTFWLTYQLFIDTLLKGFEKEIILDLATTDQKTLNWPDVTVFLKISEEGIRKFIKKGGRSFDNSEEFIRQQALPVNKMHKKFFTKKHLAQKVLTINRDALDFSKQSDFQKLLKKIEKIIKR